MGLKIRLRNLGILKQAEFSLGDLTIICGENATIQSVPKLPSANRR